MSETFEGIVRVEFDEGVIPDVVIAESVIGEPFLYDTLHGRLEKYDGQRVQVTIELLGGSTACMAALPSGSKADDPASGGK